VSVPDSSAMPGAAVGVTCAALPADLIELHPDAFTPGRVAASHMAQVPVTLAALPAGWLLLTPSTTARHFREWLASTARPFGLAARTGATVASVSGEITQ